MFSVQGIKELFSTLRFRIVMWITVVVAIMVFAANTGVREIGQRAVHMTYDEFLARMVEETANVVEKHGFPVEREKLIAVLKDKVKEHEYRSLFIQLFDGQSKLIWGSTNAALKTGAPNFESDFNGPYNSRRHRIYEKLLRTESNETYYIRCGFLQEELNDDIQLINRNIFMVSTILIILAPLGGYIIAWRATRPIANVIHTAAHLEPSNLKERLPIRGTGDEIDQLSHTINGMLDRLASYINQNRDFLANSAHELRSPLAAIRSSVEVGLNQCRTPEEYTGILVDVMEEIGRLTGLVNQLLLLAEADAAGLPARDQASRLEKLVLEASIMFDAVAEAKGVRLTLSRVDEALVPGDETSLRQIVRNLIDNAIKYNHAGGEVVVDLRVDTAKSRAMLTVRDTGAGIDKVALPRIFERFFRVDKARSRDQEERGGYGLGLSICKSIILALHGQITVESEVGKGTTFTVILPLADEAASLSNSGDRLGLTPAKPTAYREHASNKAATPE